VNQKKKVIYNIRLGGGGVSSSSIREGGLNFHSPIMISEHDQKCSYLVQGIKGEWGLSYQGGKGEAYLYVEGGIKRSPSIGRGGFHLRGKKGRIDPPAVFSKKGLHGGLRG